jgi:hypothetical protein
METSLQVASSVPPGDNPTASPHDISVALQPCPRCGYSLRGVRGRDCPECGWVIDALQLRHPMIRPIRGMTLALIAVMLVLASVTAAMYLNSPLRTDRVQVSIALAWVGSLSLPAMWWWWRQRVEWKAWVGSMQQALTPLLPWLVLAMAGIVSSSAMNIMYRVRYMRQRPDEPWWSVWQSPSGVLDLKFFSYEVLSHAFCLASLVCYTKMMMANSPSKLARWARLSFIMVCMFIIWNHVLMSLINLVF